jgi:Holliday junction resolvasome RuvABC endonuclease subunit
VTLFVGVDPDTKAPGYAIMSDGGALLDCGALHTTDLQGLATDVPRHLARLIHTNTCSVDELIVLAVEGQYIARDCKNPANILALAHAAGMCASTIGWLHMEGHQVKLMLPAPSQWKGTVSKAVHQPRIIRAIPSLLHHRHRFTAEAWSEVVDAAGIAHWAQSGGRCLKLSKPRERPVNPLRVRPGSEYRRPSRPSTRRRST